MRREPSLVIVTTSFPLASDGSEAAGSFVQDFAEEASGHIPIRVVAPGLDSTRERWSSRIEIFRYAAPRRPLSTLKLWRPDHALLALRVLAEGLRATQIAVQQDSTFHVLALWALPSGFWAQRSCNKLGIGYSVWCLGSDVWSLARNPLLRPAFRSVIRGARHSFADGIGLCSEVQAIGGQACDFLPTSRKLNPPTKEPQEAPPYHLVFLGRWHHNKGVDLLLDALQLLPSEQWARIESIDIYGGGPLAGQVHRQVRNLQVAGRPVRAHGYLPKHEAAQKISAADFLLTPSRIESIPVVFSDAMQCETPIIATPVGDLPKLVTDYSAGVIATEISAQAFSAAMIEALSSGPTSYMQGLKHASALFAVDRVCSRFFEYLKYSDTGQGPKNRLAL